MRACQVARAKTGCRQQLCPAIIARMGDPSQQLQSGNPDDASVAEELLPFVYDELRRLATKKLAREAPGQTLQATALVHEVFLRLSHQHDREWNGREHFLAAAAEAMRRILVDNARRKKSMKRGGDWQRSSLAESRIVSPCQDVDLLEVHEALNKLESEDRELGTLVKLRFFAGMTLEEIATAMGVPRRSVDRMWAYARAWLLREIGPEAEDQ